MIITSWNLMNKSVGNEENSDGIFFIDNDDNVVHLSGHYIYIKITGGNWESAEKKLGVSSGIEK